MAEELKEYEIWVEGYRANGDRGHAVIFGKESGTSFKDACERFADKHSWFKIRFDAYRMTYWGCRLFDNEVDARKSFG